MRLVRVILKLLALSTIFVEGTLAADTGPIIPNFWDSRVRLDKPTETACTIRFLASDDFPPFAFRDPAGRLTGFNVDLARVICTLRVKPFKELLPALASGEGDAVIARLELDPDASKTLANETQTADKPTIIFSAPYLKLPAHFVVRKADASDTPLLPEDMAGKWISVANHTAHADFLQKFFPESRIATYYDQQKARDALRRGEVDAHFGDGLALSYWLQGTSSVDCCVFAPGPWLEPGYFDHGLSIALRAKNEGLRTAINYALQQVNEDGRFGELYLRYFPISFY
ncbi:transporter substrate-binding domain-containing protein [Breoghania sp.]|uniref:transporter substrate-binding domain-containing protein n=1 Tax=Breoghania sp. TaxID=2065378 RepID=UPI0026313278|nr:transporter substrate-binding domain-containing protein [Breoghania sp.]MDJ0932915.1 transporter substrate-binding domain-containing protein [Breoghania sp.]